MRVQQEEIKRKALSPKIQHTYIVYRNVWQGNDRYQEQPNDFKLI